MTPAATVRAILKWPVTWQLAQLGLLSAYIIGGITKLLGFRAAVAEQLRFHLYPGWLWASLAIVVELGGAALVLSGRLVWLGAGALGVLTAVAMLVANDFWDFNGAQRFAAMNSFFEHGGLIAGLVMLAMIDQRIGRP